MTKIAAIIIAVIALLLVFLVGYSLGNKKTSDPVSNPESVPVYHYIANRNSGKLHSTDCDELPAEQNRVYFETIEDAHAAGYTNHHVECMGN